MEVDGVFSGCSTKFPCHIGWLKAALELGYEFKRFAGNSGGALVAGFFAAGVDIEHIEKCAIEQNFDRFVSGGWYARWCWKKCGYLSNGKKFFKFLRKITERKKLKDVEIDLYTIGSNYTKKSMTVFCRDTHPDMEIAEAVYISATMPGFFKPMTYKGETYRDGLIHKDYPWDLWEWDSISRKRIGHLIAFDNTSTELQPEPWSGPSEFGAMATQISYKTIKRALANGPKYPDGVTVESDGLFMDAMQFDVPLKFKKLMMREGYKNAKRELKTFLDLHKDTSNNQEDEKMVLSSSS